MGESDRYQDYKSFKSPGSNIFLGKGDNALFWLFSINIMIFLTLLMIRVSFSFVHAAPGEFEAQVLKWFAVPTNLPAFAKQPWSILTYMFAHIGLIHILTSIIWLWAFGTILQDLTGNRKLIPVYIYGGLFGALFFIAANALIPRLNNGANSDVLLGANASTMAIAVAATMLAPGYRFFRMIGGGIPIWVLTGLYVLIDIFGFAGQNPAYSISHIGGGLAGVLFVLMLRRGIDTGLWMNNLYHWFMNLFNPDKKAGSSSVKEKVFYNAGGRSPYKKTANITQQRIDDILDKISQEGYASLSDEEKKILKRASEEEL